MVQKMRLAFMMLFILLIACCSMDEATRRPSMVTVPDGLTQSKERKPQFHGGTRSPETLALAGYAGLGRVGRSHFAAVDYRARWAVIVGLNKFEHMTDLENAANDARGVRNILRDEFGYDESRIIYVTDQGRDANGKVIDKTNVTKAELLKAFEKLESFDIRSNDAVLFFFAGHGASDSNGTYLACHDAVKKDFSTWVDANVLKQKLKAINARHKLVILDSCYAGSILKVDLSDKHAEAKTPEPEPSGTFNSTDKKTRSGGDEAMELRSNLTYYLQEQAFMAITSGRNEAVSDGEGHSPFTGYLLKVLRERANSAREGDVFTARELAVRVESLVSKGQTPDWGRLGEGRGDFVFRPTRERLTPRELAERDNYAVRIALADVEIRQGNFARAQRLLDTCPKNLRHFEWHHLRGLIDNSIATLHGHAGIVGSVAISADGTRLVSGSWDRTIKVWDAENGLPLFTLVGHEGRVNSIAISANGNRIASGGDDGTIRVWDAAKKRECLLILKRKKVEKEPDKKAVAEAANEEGKEAGNKAIKRPVVEVDDVYAVAFSPDGKRIVSASKDKEIHVWDAENGGEPLLTLTGHDEPAYDVTISSDGRHIASASGDQTIKIWDAQKGGKALRTLTGHEAAPSSLAFSPDGERIVSSAVIFNVFALTLPRAEIKVWDVHKGGEALFTLRRNKSSISDVAFTTDGKRIVSAGESLPSRSSSRAVIKVWDAEKEGDALQTLYGHMSAVSSIAVSADGKYFVSGGGDYRIKIWDANRGIKSIPAQEGPVTAVAISADGKRIASGGGDKTIKVWDAEKGGVALFTLAGHDEEITSLAMSADGNRIVARSQDAVKVWDMESGGKVLRTVRAHKRSNFLTYIGHDIVAISADGKRIASVGEDNKIKVWDAEKESKALVTIQGQADGILSIAMSADGKRFTADGQDNTIKVWDVESGGEAIVTLTGNDRKGAFTLIGHDSFAMSANGKRIVSVGSEKNVKVWDAEKGGKALLNLTGHKQDVKSVAISADGKRIATGSTDNTIKVWDGEKGGQPLFTLSEHIGEVTSVAISADGKRVVSASRDGTVKVWELENENRVRHTFRGHFGKYEFVAFTADGKHIMTKGGFNVIRLWDAEKGGPALRTLTSHIDQVTAATITADGKRILSGGKAGTIMVWDAEMVAKPLMTLVGHKRNVTGIVVSADGNRIVSSSWDNTIKVWDGNKGGNAIHSLEGHGTGVTSVAISKDNKRIVSGSWDKKVKVWDMEKGGPALLSLEGHGREIYAVAMSNDGERIVSGCLDSTIKVWDAKKGGEALLTLLGHEGSVHAVAFSADGKRIVSASEDNTIKLWDAERGGEPLLTLSGHTGVVNAIAISADGKRIMSGSWDSTVRVWESAHWPK